MGRKLEFSNLIIEGFSSFSYPVSFDLNRGGINMIYGKNGHGKSTLFAALVWVLWKMSLKKITLDNISTWPEYRHPGFRGTRVVVEFFDDEDNSFMIARHINFKGTTKGRKGENSLMIFKNGELLGEELHKGDQEGYIERLIGMDGKAFINSIVFGQRMQRLVESDNKDKRDLFEKLFEVEFIEEAKQKASKYLQEQENVITVLSSVIRENEASLNRQNSKLKESENLLGDYNTKKEARVKSFEDKLAEARKDLVKLEHTEFVEFKGKDIQHTEQHDKEKLRELKATLNSCNQELIELKGVSSQISRDLSSTKFEIKKATDNISKFDEELKEVKETCPYCNGKLKEAEVRAVKNNIKDRIDKEQEIIKIFSADALKLEESKVSNAEAIQNKLKEFTPLEESITALESKLEKYSEFSSKRAVLKNQIDNAKSKIGDLEIMLVEAKNEQPPKIDLEAIRESIKEIGEKVSEASKSLKAAQEEAARTQWWISKGFSSSGLKAYVFSSMLASLNMYADVYAEQLGIKILFSIDLSKASKPFVTKCYLDGYERNYESLSGGQKQRVDVCLAFAMHDISSHAAAWINLFIMDEVFEGLDQEGMEAVFELIRMKADEGKSVYVISHSQTVTTTHAKSIKVFMDELKHSYIE